MSDEQRSPTRFNDTNLGDKEMARNGRLPQHGCNSLGRATSPMEGDTENDKVHAMTCCLST
eukprot:13946290-Heterocapsa_arctica.AAC.1